MRKLVSGLILLAFSGVVFADENTESVGARADLPTVFMSADVVFLGEIHDNPDHHHRQAQWVAGLKPAAVVLEMLDADQAASITDSLRDDPAALAVALDWANSGWPDFAMYYPVLQAAGAAQIYGAHVGREQARAALGQGVAASFGDQVAQFGLTRPLPDEQQLQRQQMQQTAHCNALPENLLPGMVALQRLRDAQLARVALQAYHETGGPVVVITGNGHARQDWGAPAALALARPALSLASLGQGESENPPDGGFDLVLYAPAVEREDPCAAFK